MSGFETKVFVQFHEVDSRLVLLNDSARSLPVFSPSEKILRVNR
ncbi:hypothetical protein NOR51B_2764 [Luminiphilus syltensis NOR5-1B]|uniref:Uncharacterized protein n=1 Tax=Luminiphilus syltensis NOR5-1B TaxID=565045 RepID=B8KXT5_9GAMM|nr:hypothetical protein NOR51B_2764 [Luminiphilus syltensis NOR5-1B]